MNVLGELIVHTIYFKVAFRWQAASVREKFPSLPDPYDIYDMDRSIMTVDQSHRRLLVLITNHSNIKQLVKEFLVVG